MFVIHAKLGGAIYVDKILKSHKDAQIALTGGVREVVRLVWSGTMDSTSR
jgi:hypothetical protein